MKLFEYENVRLRFTEADALAPAQSPSRRLERKIGARRRCA